MRRRATGSTILLTAAGGLLMLVAIAAVIAGAAFSEQIHAQLPPITADARAVGGAAVALGIACALAGLVHLVLALGLSRGARRALVPAIVVCALMAVLALGWSAAALVSAASGSGPAVAMLPAGIGLLVLSGAYALAGGVLSGAWRDAGRREAGPPEAGPPG